MLNVLIAVARSSLENVLDSLTTVGLLEQRSRGFFLLLFSSVFWTELVRCRESALRSCAWLRSCVSAGGDVGAGRFLFLVFSLRPVVGAEERCELGVQIRSIYTP